MTGLEGDTAITPQNCPGLPTHLEAVGPHQRPQEEQPLVWSEPASERAKSRPGRCAWSAP